MKGKDKVGDFYGGSNYIPTRRLTRYSALVCLFLLACLLAISALHESNDQSSSEQFYAICSEEGTKAIYTVDKDNTSVQCALVKGGKFLDTGDLSSCYDPLQRDPTSSRILLQMNFSYDIKPVSLCSTFLETQQSFLA